MAAICRKFIPHALAILASACASSIEVTSPPTVEAPKSCAAGLRCGALDCCESPVVEGGAFDRNNDPALPAMVSSFRLDTFEVTVGRMRAFVDVYPGSRPKEGDGAHPKLPWSGWRIEWDEALPETQEALRQQLSTVTDLTETSYNKQALLTWTDALGTHDDAAANNLTWYLAFAFCAWDGGRLPTHAEWNYAAVGGSEQRAYPWGEEQTDDTRVVARASKDELPQAFLPVGSRPLGVGRFGQLDLGGNRTEWVLDGDSPNKYGYPIPCNDCAKVADTKEFLWRMSEDMNMTMLWPEPNGYQVTRRTASAPPSNTTIGIGVRCVRDLEPVPPPAPTQPEGPRSCPAALQCGSPTQSCCASPVVEGGNFNRNNDPAWPATLSSFRLDTFEVTVGRMRAFVEAYPASRPRERDGVHPKLPWSGWRSEWDAEIPITQEALREELSVAVPRIQTWYDDQDLVTWTDAPGAHEDVAVNNVTWYLAFAFCAWDGGRLPTHAEWNYAVVGGSEQRTNPWGEEPTDSSRAVLLEQSDDLPDAFAPVGSRPLGIGRFGQLDFSGNRMEWALDAVDPYTMPIDNRGYPLPCVDCATVPSLSADWRTEEDGSMSSVDVSPVALRYRPAPPRGKDIFMGIRCARDLP